MVSAAAAIAQALPVGTAAEKLYELRKLWLAGALDGAAGDARLRLFEGHLNRRVAKLASGIRLEIAATVLTNTGAAIR
jgi:hypothetical protein